VHIVTGEEMYAIDRYTIEEVGLAGQMLMENAGQAVARMLFRRLKQSDSIAVMIGTGNNGGDGFVIARVLLEKGYGVQVWLVPPRKKLKGDAKKHMEIFERTGHEFQCYRGNEAVFSDRVQCCTVIIDALLGTGVKGAPRSPYREMIADMNASRAFVVSVDIPSGVPADGGKPEIAVEADETLTLQSPKLGLFTPNQANYYGKWDVLDIGIPNKAVTAIAGTRKLWQREDVSGSLPERSASSHKGTHGKGLLAAGSRSMTGAPVLAAQSALRGGSGLLTVALPDVIHPVVAGHVVEATYALCPASTDGLFSGELPIELSYDGIAAGPGMGREKGGYMLVAKLLKEAACPLLLDADALFHVQSCKSLLKERKRSTILTPHPGEMARLADCSVQDVQQNRFQIARDFATTYGVYLVLKGPSTIVTTPDGMQYVNPTGNASLAKGGTGDVLTGLILAFMMQHNSLQAAISNAVYIHGEVADILTAEDHSSLDVLATDVIEAFPRVFRSLYSTCSTRRTKRAE
jgi:hydroxyethylthiazole kinase-like uncharacterized protein yjeF